MQSTNFTAGYTLYNCVCGKKTDSSSSSFVLLIPWVKFPGWLRLFFFCLQNVLFYSEHFATLERTNVTTYCKNYI